MTDHEPPSPDPGSVPPEPSDPTTGNAPAANSWEFEQPDPNLSFHGDIPTDPSALEDRPTTEAPVPPPAGAAAAAPTPPPTSPPPPDAASTEEPFDPNATRAVAVGAPLLTPQPGPATTSGGRVGTRTAMIAIGAAAVLALLIIGGLALTGGDDDGDVTAGGATPSPEPTADATPEAAPTEVAEPTAEAATPTPVPTAAPVTAATDLASAETPFGAMVTERWELDDGVLSSTLEIGNATDATIGGVHVVIVPTSVTTDLATISFDPEPDDAVAADDPAAAYEVSLAPDDEPLVITWRTDIDAPAGETPAETLERLLADRAAAAFRFAADTPDLTINAPDDGSTTIGSSVRLRGSTDADATVTINGNDIAVDDGRFSTEIDRGPDRRQLRVVATDPYGRTTMVTWTVRFADPAPTPTPRPVVVPTTPPVVQPPPPPTQPPVCPPTDDSCR